MKIDVETVSGFPAQKLPYKKKTKEWAAKCVAFGADQNLFTSSPIVKSVYHKQINYDLLNGKLHMEDLKMIINPANLSAGYMPKNIQHYPIMNSKINVLRGEESARGFDYKVIVTNPNALSEIEKNKAAMMSQLIQQEIAETSTSEEEFAKRIQEIYDYMTYSWQDARELLGNEVLSHYNAEYNFTNLFNQGFVDVCSVGEEIYQVYILKGEPCIRKINPKSIRVYKTGTSNRIEDADMVVIEEYWNKGRIIDVYGELLTNDDLNYIQKFDTSYQDDNRSIYAIGNGPQQGLNYTIDSDGETTYYREDVLRNDISGDTVSSLSWESSDTLSASDLTAGYEIAPGIPQDVYGNIRVCQVYWKSLRKIKKIKSYDPITGEEYFHLETEEYIINKDRGETEDIMWINEAWHGTRIGDKVYVDMGPCPVQFNTIDDPSKCHFGIIGTIYNLGDDAPFSLVDMMKPYNYLYDCIFDRLNRLIAKNHGKAIRLDLSRVPEKWTMEQWTNILVNAGIYVEDSFRAGNEGPAKGKLAGALNNASSGSIDMELSQSISGLLNLLISLEQMMGKVVGITDQREGQIQNRETVGGVERSVLQSSHITEWLYVMHDDTKRRALNSFLDITRAAFRGKHKKFPYITSSDLAQKIIDVDGDFFSSSSYGILVDNSGNSQEFKKNLPMIIQAGLQTQALDLSTIIKVYNSSSRAEQQKAIEKGEAALQQRVAEQQQMQYQSQQQIAQANQQTELAKMEQEERMNKENNETKILIATIQSANNQQPQVDKSMSDSERANLNEKIREFNANLALSRDKLEFDKENAKEINKLKEKQINKKTSSNK